MAEARTRNQLLLLSPREGERLERCRPMAIRAVFAGEKQVWKGIEVEADIAAYGGFRQRVRLIDDGRHQDGGLRDGLYGGIFEPCAQTRETGATYELKVTARNSRLTRSAVRSFFAR